MIRIRIRIRMGTEFSPPRQRLGSVTSVPAYRFKKLQAPRTQTSEKPQTSSSSQPNPFRLPPPRRTSISA